MVNFARTPLFSFLGKLNYATVNLTPILAVTFQVSNRINTLTVKAL